jgi:hypothetical protein
MLVNLFALRAGVHVDFHANLHFNDLRFFPGHLANSLVSGAIAAAAFGRGHADGGGGHQYLQSGHHCYSVFEYPNALYLVRRRRHPNKLEFIVV